MRLFRRREPVLPVATNAVPPTYATFADFQDHALRFPQNGWYEPMPAFGGTVGTVDRCLQLNSQQVATMPLRYQHTADILGYEPAWVHDPDPAWYPNGIGDAVFAATWSMYAQGEAFLYVTGRYENGYPRTWTILDPVTMKVNDAGGVRAYESNGFPLVARDVIQVQRDPRGQLRGRSSLASYWSNVTSASQAEAYAADVYSSGGVTRLALKSKGRRITQAQATELQTDWIAAVSKRMGAPAILPPDLELLETLSISPKDLMLLESREWDARQIAAAFGVPAMLLNIAVAGGLTYQNPIQLFGLWWRAELMPAAVKIAAALSRWLPRGQWVEFDPSQVLRPDLETLVSTYSTMLADGVITVDEYRAAVLDLPPLIVGDQAAELFAEAGAHGNDLEVAP